MNADKVTGTDGNEDTNDDSEEKECNNESSSLPPAVTENATETEVELELSESKMNRPRNPQLQRTRLKPMLIMMRKPMWETQKNNLNQSHLPMQSLNTKLSPRRKKHL